MSLGSLLLTVAVARRTDVSGLGDFSVALSVILITGGFATAAVAEPLSATRPSDVAVFRAAHRATLLGFCVLPFAALLAFMLQSPPILAAATASPFVALFSHYRYMHIAVRGGRTPILMELPRAFIALGALIMSIMNIGSSLPFLVAWLLSITATALLLFLRDWHRFHTSAPRHDTALPFSQAFGIQYLVGSGAVHLTTLLLALVADKAVNGALRGGATLLGPLAFFVTALQTLLIPLLASAGPARLRTAAVISGAGATAVAIGVSLLGIIPASLGESILGETWSVARPLLPLMGLDLVFATASSPAQAGLKSVLAGRSLLRTQLLVSPVRVTLVLTFAATAGAYGAALAMASASILSAVLWWMTWIRVGRSRRQS